VKKEQKQLLFFVIRALGLLAFASLYAIGGSGDFWGGELWIRRWLAPFLLAGVGFGVSLDWRMLAAYPVMGAALTLPYGADVEWQKWLLRGLFGLACGIAFNIPNFLNKRWVLAGYGIALGVTASILLGVFNLTPDAVIEQGCIGLLLGFTYIFGAKKKGE
jgi:hypothetical protein